jgi:ubiquinone biosynthesis protein UbiJ
MTSKRRMRRIRGKMRAATVAGGTRRGLQQAIEPANDRRSFSTNELSEEQAEAIKNAKMDARHDHLNVLLEDDFGRRLLAQKGSIPPDVVLEF